MYEELDKTALSRHPAWFANAPGLGVIAVAGADAVAFLHGQLTADIASLSAGEWRPAALCNPKGRVLAVVRVIVDAPDACRMWLPRELVPGIIAHLQRYVMRSKVTLRDAGDDPALTALPAGIEPPDEIDAIRTGLPEVYSATQGEFVAQMLNLDLVGAISFTKGCYPGQEIIARAHNLGRIKRRVRRYAAVVVAPPEPGADLLAGEQKIGQVVRAVSGHGASELLAIVALDPQGAGPSGQADFTSLPLPYAALATG